MSAKRMIPAADILDLPVQVTIPIFSRIDKMADTLRKGGFIGHVAAAQVGSKTYAVDRIDALLAYRKCGAEKVPCTVAAAASEAEAQSMHIRLSQNLPVNPFQVIAAVQYVREKFGEEIGFVLTPEHSKLARLNLSGEVRSKMSEYITELGQRLDDVPSFFHIFRELARVEASKQAKALDSLIAYCDSIAQAGHAFSLPDSFMAEKILRQFAPRLTPCAPKTESDSGKGKSPEAAGSRMPAVPVTSDSDESACRMRSSGQSSLQMQCECGREYVIDTKAKTVKSRTERTDLVLLQGEYGKKAFGLRSSDAEYLELDDDSVVHCYHGDRARRGEFLIFSKKQLRRELLAAVRKAFKNGS